MQPMADTDATVMLGSDFLHTLVVTVPGTEHHRGPAPSVHGLLTPETTLRVNALPVLTVGKLRLGWGVAELGWELR